MKKSLLLIFLWIILPYLFFFCDDLLLDSDQKEAIITKIDMEEMAHRHLSGFSLLRERSNGDIGTEYVFTRESDSVNAFIIVGLHSSAKDAENVVLDYLNGISMVMKNGPIPGESIGDKLWWWSPNSDPDDVTDIVFIRENALFIMSCWNNEKIKTLAKAIDYDIIGKASYITFKN